MAPGAALSSLAAGGPPGSSGGFAAAAGAWADAGSAEGAVRAAAEALQVCAPRPLPGCRTWDLLRGRRAAARRAASPAVARVRAVAQQGVARALRPPCASPAPMAALGPRHALPRRQHHLSPPRSLLPPRCPCALQVQTQALSWSVPGPLRRAMAALLPAATSAGIAGAPRSACPL
jgi:hypothetical protein